MKSHNYLSVAIKHLVQLFSRQSVSTTHTLPKIIRKIEVPIPIPLRVPHVFKTWLQAAAINLPQIYMQRVGFEPTKLVRQIYSLIHLTTLEPLQ